MNLLLRRHKKDRFSKHLNICHTIDGIYCVSWNVAERKDGTFKKHTATEQMQIFPKYTERPKPKKAFSESKEAK